MTDSMGCARSTDIGYLKLSGALRHDCAGPLEALIESWFADDEDAVRAVVIDLNDATFMDSTVIGLLAAIARELTAHKQPPPTVFSTNPEINQLLTSLRLDDVFTLVEHATDRHLAGGELHALESNGCAQPCSPQAILKAHEVLVELNEANRVAFQPVVDMFREELSRK